VGSDTIFIARSDLDVAIRWRESIPLRVTNSLSSVVDRRGASLRVDWRKPVIRCFFSKPAVMTIRAFIHMPGAFIRLFGTERVAMYRTTTQSHAGSRPLFVPQANTLGGGSSVNAMIYIRGTAEDYDEWRALGCDGWGWDDVLPVFKRSEGNETLSGPYHGVDGPLKIGNAWHGLPTNLAFVKAGQEIGLPYNHDFNGVSQEGVGLYQSTSFKGRRSSTAAVYLAPLKNKPNLTILTDCRVLRLLTEGTRVTGVAYRTRSGATTEARASRQVVLAAGALASPKIHRRRF
jgi:choline dehydrogenase